MASGANRIFKIIQNTNKDTISEVVYLTVKSLNPLVLNLEDRLDLTEEFLIFSDHIVKSRLQIGDILTGTTYNDGQKYYVTQGLKKDLRRKVIDNLNSGSDIDSLSARQGAVLLGMINELESQVSELQGQLQSSNSAISGLESRVSSLESK